MVGDGAIAYFPLNFPLGQLFSFRRNAHVAVDVGRRLAKSRVDISGKSPAVDFVNKPTQYQRTDMTDRETAV